MKISILSGLLLTSISSILFAQNNTFPSTGSVGIGTLSPHAKLHVYQSQRLGTELNNFSLLATFSASAHANNVQNNVWLVRDSPGDSWLTSRLHDGISVDVSFRNPRVDSKTWWERDPYNDIQSWGQAGLTYLTINKGNVGIGTTDTRGYKLAVNGKVRAKEVKVEATNWPDYVFSSSHEKPSLKDLEVYINDNKHLPEIPSAKQVEDEGLSLGEMNALLLKKIEELTLYLIEQNKKSEKQERRIGELERLIKP
ncbi:hypothetical protein [Arcticibacter sp.]|uniref:hypothetical protein n=1 Tax=Arcticibacter sp. TaxID=1872630 RepID=UPI003890D30E